METTTSRITKTPGIQGGDACVDGTRVPVWVLWGWRRFDKDDAWLLDSYPSLTQDDLDAAWAYAAANRDELERTIRENEEGDEGFSE